MLREVDPYHDIFVGQVGVWMPWDPTAYKTGKVEYVEEELNQLMNEKKKNELQAKRAFEKRIRETKKKAIEENKAMAKKTGVKLTQDVTEDGELIGVQNRNTIEKTLGENEKISTADIRKELFEGENIRVKGSDDPQKAYKNALNAIGKKSEFADTELFGDEDKHTNKKIDK